MINPSLQENQQLSKNQNKWKETWRRLKKNKTAILGLVILIVFVLVAIFADVIAPYDKGIKMDAKN